MIYTCQTCATQERTEDEDPLIERTSLVKSRYRWCKPCNATTYQFAARHNPVRAEHERIIPKLSERVQPVPNLLTSPRPRR